MSSSAPDHPPTPSYPHGPLNLADAPGAVAVRVGLYLRITGTVDAVISADEIDRHGGLGEAVEARREDLMQDFLQQGGLTEDDVDVEDIDEWQPATGQWFTVEA